MATATSGKLVLPVVPLARLVLCLGLLLPSLPCPLILAGEVMDHMISSPGPTRSEVCHLADAVAHGFSGCVLSNETIYGKHALEVPQVVREVTLAVQRSRAEDGEDGSGTAAKKQRTE